MCVFVIWHFETLALIRRTASTRRSCAATCIKSVKHAHPHTHNVCFQALEASTTEDSAHTHVRPPRERLLCQGAELSSTCLGITINSIAQAWLDPHPAKPSAQHRQHRVVNRQWRQFAHRSLTFCRYAILSDVGGMRNSALLKPIYTDIFRILLLRFFPR